MYSSPFTAGYQFAFRSDHFSAYFTTLIECRDRPLADWLKRANNFQFLLIADAELGLRVMINQNKIRPAFDTHFIAKKDFSTKMHPNSRKHRPTSTFCSLLIASRKKSEYRSW